MMSAHKSLKLVWRRVSSVQIPKRKEWTEGDIISILRSTVPKPELPIPWAEGIQHEQSFDYDRGDAVSGNKKKGSLMIKRDLGRKAAEYAIRKLKTEFEHDFSKGEFGNARKYLQSESILVNEADEMVEADLEEYIEWINFRPFKADIPEWVRKAFPTREIDEISRVIDMLHDKIKNSKGSEKDNFVYKLDLAVSLYLKQPAVNFEDKFEMFNQHIKRYPSNSLQYTNLVCDIFDALYFNKTFIKESTSDSIEEKILALFETVEIPTTRYFNSYLRIYPEGPKTSEFGLGIQKEMEKLGLKTSPATFVAVYRLLDNNHRQILREQIDERVHLGFASSDDFYDFYGFLQLVKQLETESQVERKYRSKKKRSLFDSHQKETTSPFYLRSKMYEKLIFQNPSFIPRDAFNEIFNILKMTQIRYSPTAEDVWDAFIESPSQDFSLQAEVLSWAQSNNHLGLAAELWQYLDASDSLRFNNVTTNNIIYFIKRRSAFPTKKSEANQMCHICKTMLEMLSDKDEIWQDPILMEQIKSQASGLVDLCFGTLMKFDNWEPIRDFLKIDAISPGRPDTTPALANEVFAYAVKNKITSLADACLYIEKRARNIKLGEEIVEEYRNYLTSQETLLLY